MLKYIRHIQSKPPHQRRQHAIQIAGVFTAAVFVVWITTLGMRLASSSNTIAQNPDSNETQLANASSIFGTQSNTLEVATTTSGSSGVILPYAQNP